MKYSFVLLLSATIILIACARENTPEIVWDNTVDTTIAMPQNNGNFMNGPSGAVSGMATVYKQDESLVLALENRSISKGPQLQVYRSKEVKPVNFSDLEPLQSTMGNQLYAITGRPDLLQHKYALINCKKYNHLFVSSKLQ